MESKAAGARVSRVLIAVALVAGTTAAVSIAAPAAMAAPPATPTYKALTQTYTSPGTYTFTVPAGTAAIAVAVQGGSGQNGSGPDGGFGRGAGAGAVVQAVAAAGHLAQIHDGDNLTIQVGGQGGHNVGSTCAGGNGGGGNELGLAGGQGGQCSFVRDGSLLAVAGGGGGGGGIGGGGGRGGDGGIGGYDSVPNDTAGANPVDTANGQNGARGSLGGAAGGADTVSCASLLSSQSGSGGASAANLSDAGGGGGGGGGCGTAGGGGADFEGGGGGAGGGSGAIHNNINGFVPPSEFALAPALGDGSVVLYALPGTDSAISHVELGKSPLTEVPSDAASMIYMVRGATAIEGAPGGVAFGTEAVGLTSPVHGGDALISGQGDSSVGGSGPSCAGGVGGAAAGTNPPGRPGAPCAYVETKAPFASAPVGLGVGGGGGGKGDTAGGAAGQPGGTQGTAHGGAGGSCTSFEVDPGGAGSNAIAGFTNAGAGGGGGCGAGGGGFDQPSSFGGALAGGGGGGGNFAANSSYASGTTYTSAERASNIPPEVWVMFTRGTGPAITSANSANFFAGQTSSFTVTASGAPAATIEESGSLPSGVSFTDNGDGTATISGNPPASAFGSSPLTITAFNPIGVVHQSFTLGVVAPPSFITSNTGAVNEGQSNTVPIHTGGFPAPHLSESGALPTGITFTDVGGGSATLTGTPAAGSNDFYNFDITADNGNPPAAIQHYTLQVNGPPTFTSANTATFTTGSNGSFTVKTTGQPPPILKEVTGATGTGMPLGVSFNDNGDGTGTISGTPASGQTGTFTFLLTAENQFTTTTQNFTLVVNGAPTFLSGNSYTYPGTGSADFPITTTGLPLLSLRTDPGQTGPPTGVTLNTTGIGTGALTGTPTSAPGVYTFTLVATNGSGTATQPFTFLFQGPATFTSPDHVTFTENQPGTFTVQMAANPPVQFLGIPLTDSNPLHGLPAGMSLTYSRGDNFATISGTPALGSSNVYTMTIDAESFPGGSIAHTLQPFTVTVIGPPRITSPNSTAFTMGVANDFTIQVAGQPRATSITATGLPAWAQIINNGDDTATLTGTPPVGSPTSIPLTITADNGNAPAATQTFTLNLVGPPTRLVLSPATQNIQVGSGQNYHAEAFDAFNEDLGDVTGRTTFTMTNGSCGGSLCTSTVAGQQTVTGTLGKATGTATLNEAPGGPAKITMTPATATIRTGTSQTYQVTTADVFNNPLGSVSGSVLNTLTISPDGSCDKTAISCTATTPGPHTVTATYGTNQAQATLNVSITLIQGPKSANSPYGTAYSGALGLTNGTAPFSFNATSGATASVHVSSTGAITAPGTLPLGAYTVSGTDSDPLGDAGTWTFTLNVQRAPLTITASAVTFYSGPAPTATPQFAGFVNGDSKSVLTNQPTCTTDYTPGMAAGSYPGKTHCSGATAANYAITFLAGTLIVNPAPLTVTASNGDMNYGGTPPTITPSFTGFVNGDGSSALSTLPTCTTAATAHSAVGPYATSCVGGAGANYVLGYLGGTVTVHPAPLTVTASSPHVAYGLAPPAITPSYTGFVNGENASALKTPPVCSTTATAASVPGPYSTNCSGASAVNYTIGYTAGTLTVDKATTSVALTSPGPSSSVFGQPITFSAKVSRTSGSAAPSGTVQFKDGTTALGAPVAVNTATGVASLVVNSLAAGATSHAITAVYSGDGNYGTSTSNPLSQSVGIDGTHTGATSTGPVTYGQPVTVTATVTPIAPGVLTPTGSVQFKNGAQNIGGPVALSGGTASVIINNLLPAQTITAAYGGTTNFAPSSGSVGPVVNYTPVTLRQGTPTSAMSTYGSPYSGKLKLTNAPVAATFTATSGDMTNLHVDSAGNLTAPGSLPVGRYTFGGTDTDALHDSGTWTFTLVVGPAHLTVTASNASATYGGPAPTSTPNVVGFVNGQNASVLTTQPTCTTDFTATLAAASYPGKTHCAGAAAANYAFSYVAGTLTVKPRAATITASNATMTYGGAVPSITPSYTGFVNGDSAMSLAIPPSCSTAATSHSPVGPYASRCTGAVANNYAFTYATGTVSVRPASLRITASSPHMPFGGPVPAITPSYAGFVNGETASALTTNPTCSTTATATSPPGTYPTHCSGAADANYTISYVGGILTVDKGVTKTAVTSTGPVTLGQPVTVTATVTPVAPASGTPTGLVQFKKGSQNLGPPVALSGGRASVTVAGLTPSQTIAASYGGDPTFRGSGGSISPTVNVSHVVSGTQSSALTLNGGSWLINGAALSSPLAIGPNTSVAIINSTLRGAVTATNGASFTMCGSTMNAGLSITGATGFVLIGDPIDDGCAGNDISGGVGIYSGQAGLNLVGNRLSSGASVAGNSGGGPLAVDVAPVVGANSITGSLGCSKNTPVPVNGGSPNTGTESGQCAGL